MPSTEKISFRNSRGLRLSGILKLPAGDPHPIWAILSHGMLSSKDSRKHSELSRLLCEKGVAALRFDFSGQGESEGSAEVITNSNGIDDLSSAIKFLEGLGAERFLLAGSSMGAGVSILTAARFPSEVSGLALLSSVVHSNMIWDAMTADQRREWRTSGIFSFEGRRVAFDTVEDGRKHDIPGTLRAYRGPVLFVHGTEDELIDYRLVEELAGSREAPTEIKIVIDADHRFSEDEHRSQALAAVVEWVSRSLLS